MLNVGKYTGWYCIGFTNVSSDCSDPVYLWNIQFYNVLCTFTPFIHQLRPKQIGHGTRFYMLTSLTASNLVCCFQPVDLNAPHRSARYPFPANWSGNPEHSVVKLRFPTTGKMDCLAYELWIKMPDLLGSKADSYRFVKGQPIVQ